MTAFSAYCPMGERRFSFLGKKHFDQYTKLQMHEGVKNIYLEIAFSHLISSTLSHCWFGNGV